MVESNIGYIEKVILLTEAVFLEEI